MGLINDREEVVGKEIDQCSRLGSGRTTGEMAGVVLNSLAKPHFLHHLDVVFGPLLDTLGLKVLLVLFEMLNALR